MGKESVCYVDMRLGVWIPVPTLTPAAWQPAHNLSMGKTETRTIWPLEKLNQPALGSTVRPSTRCLPLASTHAVLENTHTKKISKMIMWYSWLRKRHLSQKFKTNSNTLRRCLPPPHKQNNNKKDSVNY